VRAGLLLMMKKKKYKFAKWSSVLLPAHAELMALQAVRQQASLLKLQRSQRDQEPPDTAGLDIALAETLLQLGQQTKLASVQVRLA
jgi:hypothetical protein